MMDSNTLNQFVADSIATDKPTVEALMESFAKVITDSAASMTSIAVPSFGSFVPVKYDEEIKSDLSTGKKMLFPPQIVIEFQPAASLRKKITESHD